ncbi:MAG TPA: hypothetical protein VJP07_07240 [Dehalococcoidia bacterium]|nr:hypothetical protein [Dehalococcoidia bacterium]
MVRFGIAVGMLALLAGISAAIYATLAAGSGDKSSVGRTTPRNIAPVIACVETEHVFSTDDQGYDDFTSARLAAEGVAGRQLPLPVAPAWVDRFEAGKHTALRLPVPNEPRLIDGAAFKYAADDGSETILVEFYPQIPCVVRNTGRSEVIEVGSRSLEVWPSSSAGTDGIGVVTREFEGRRAVFMLNDWTVVISIEWTSSTAPDSGALTSEIIGWIQAVAQEEGY